MEPGTFFLTPSQNFLAENFTLPQVEGDEPVYVARFTKKGTWYLFSLNGYFFNARLRRFSQSKFHFDFEDDSATGTASHSLLVPLFAKNSRLGYFFYANNLK